MNNQPNIGEQFSLPREQVNTNPVEVAKVKKKPNYLVIFLLVSLIILSGVVGYLVGKEPSNTEITPQPNPIPNIEDQDNPELEKDPEPVEKPVEDPTSSWKLYNIVVDSSLGLANYSIKVPDSLVQVEHSSNFQEIETFKGNINSSEYTLIIQQESNNNPETGRPYSTLEELVNLPYDVPSKMVGGQQALQVLPRAGSETVYKVLFFSPDKTLVFSIELETPIDGSKLTEGETLFNQILSTFIF